MSLNPNIIVMFETHGIGQTSSSLKRYLVLTAFYIPSPLLTPPPRPFLLLGHNSMPRIRYDDRYRSKS